MNTYTMIMMMMIISCMIFKDLVYLKTSGYSQLARPCKSRWCAKPPGEHTLARVGFVYGLHIQFVSTGDHL